MRRKRIKKEKIGCFISIPKCGSKSILKILDMGKNRDNDSDYDSDIIYENHQRLSVLEKKYDLTNKFTFCFSRNPYNRIISWFNYHKYSSKNNFYTNYTLEEWIKAKCPVHWVKQNETNWKQENITPLLQYNFINANKKIDYIGKMENFNIDLNNIVNIINDIYKNNNINKTIIFKNIKINTSNHIEKELNDECKDIIYNIFKKDFDFFKYNK